jgi:hypothetical protein
VATPGTQENFVLPIAPVKLPGRLEELEELIHNWVLRRIRNDADHHQQDFLNDL